MGSSLTYCKGLIQHICNLKWLKYASGYEQAGVQSNFNPCMVVVELCFIGIHITKLKSIERYFRQNCFSGK